MTCGIAYSGELSLLLWTSLLIFLGLVCGYRLGEFVVLVGATATAILLLGRIRSRSKLIKVGFLAGIATSALSLITGLLEGQALGRAPRRNGIPQRHVGLCRRVLRDRFAPFYRERVRRAHGYQLAGAGGRLASAVTRIGRRRQALTTTRSTWLRLPRRPPKRSGLAACLVRVAAYFHDVGKMLKPGYFVENQGGRVIATTTLVPAMSTLIIIGHVKDGVDLAREHHVPRAGDRLYRAAPRHDPGRILLSPG